MKIREGFVSNSSSSSFIVRKDEYQSPAILASIMIPNRVSRANTNSELSSKAKVYDRKVKLKCLSDNTKYTKNIHFQSCNYDTYIAEIGDYLVVETCNNEDWPLLNTVNLSEIPDDIWERILYSSTDEEEREYYENNRKSDKYYRSSEEISIQDKFEFHSLDLNVVGKRADNYAYCRKCGIGYWNIDGVDKCPKCKQTDTKY